MAEPSPIHRIVDADEFLTVDPVRRVLIAQLTDPSGRDVWWEWNVVAQEGLGIDPTLTRYSKPWGPLLPKDDEPDLIDPPVRSNRPGWRRSPAPLASYEVALSDLTV